MRDFEDRLRKELRKLGALADPSGVYDRVHERKVRRRIMRKLEAATLAVVVVAGTAGGGYALVRALDFGADDAVLPASAEAGLIAFVSETNFRGDIAVMEADGRMRVSLTHGSDDRSPSWSPDGSRIAFVSNRQGPTYIYVMNGDGSEVVRVLGDQDPAWSPDGTRLAWVSNVGANTSDSLMVSRIDGSDSVQLASGQYGFDHPAWSPDGTRIAYTTWEEAPCPTGSECWPSRGAGIYVVNVERRDVGHFGPPVGARHAAWSPDGTRIAYSGPSPVVASCPPPPPGTPFHCPTGPPPQLSVVTLDGTITKLTDLPEGANNPAWSPDSSRIAFDSGGDIYVIDADGSNLRPLTHGPRVDTDPSWQAAPGGRPSVPPRPSPATPSLPPAPSTAAPSPTPSPFPSPTPSPAPPCSVDQSHAEGDFDGDGITEFAFVGLAGCLAPDSGIPADQFVVSLEWSGGGAGAAPLLGTQPDRAACAEVCLALAATDLNGDGIAELVIQVGSGASTDFVQIYAVQPSEAFGDPAVVAPPGAEGFPEGEPARFGSGGSVTHQDFLTCRTDVSGEHQVIATSASSRDPFTEWALHETVFTFDPMVQPPAGAFTVISTRDYTQPYDGDPQVEGEPCWAG